MIRKSRLEQGRVWSARIWRREQMSTE